MSQQGVVTQRRNFSAEYKREAVALPDTPEFSTDFPRSVGSPPRRLGRQGATESRE